MAGLSTPSTGRAVEGGTTGSTGRNAKQPKWMGYATTGVNKAVSLSDWASKYINGVSHSIGGENCWPKSGDYIEEIEKCTRILNGFTQQGFVREEEQEVAADDPNGKEVEQTIGPEGQALTEEEVAKLPADETRTSKITKKIRKVKIIRKIPPEVIRKACGIAIYSSLRYGIAPFGGSGGSGVVMARLPDGSWSPPSFIAPQNMSVGLLFGADVYEVVVLVMSEQALEGFKTDKVTLGAETAIAAGPVGTGASMDMSINGVDWSNSKTDVSEGEKRKLAKPPVPLFSYSRNRGFYGGIEGMAMCYLTRFDENERVYHWPGVKARDVLDGRVRKPVEARMLYEALAAAESGQAQATVSRLPKELELAALAELSQQHSTPKPPLEHDTGSTTGSYRDGLSIKTGSDESQDANGELVLDEGERLCLPPTPEQLDFMEQAGIKDDEDERLEADYKAWVWSLRPPPRHPIAEKQADGIARTKGGKRFVAPLSTTPSPPPKNNARFVAPDPRFQDAAPSPLQRSVSAESTGTLRPKKVDPPVHPIGEANVPVPEEKAQLTENGAPTTSQVVGISASVAGVTAGSAILLSEHEKDTAGHKSSEDSEAVTVAPIPATDEASEGRASPIAINVNSDDVELHNIPPSPEEKEVEPSQPEQKEENKPVETPQESAPQEVSVAEAVVTPSVDEADPKEPGAEPKPEAEEPEPVERREELAAEDPAALLAESEALTNAQDEVQFDSKPSSPHPEEAKEESQGRQIDGDEPEPAEEANQKETKKQRRKTATELLLDSMWSGRTGTPRPGLGLLPEEGKSATPVARSYTPNRLFASESQDEHEEPKAPSPISETHHQKVAAPVARRESLHLGMDNDDLDDLNDLDEVSEPQESESGPSTRQSIDSWRPNYDTDEEEDNTTDAFAMLSQRFSTLPPTDGQEKQEEVQEQGEAEQLQSHQEVQSFAEPTAAPTPAPGVALPSESQPVIESEPVQEAGVEHPAELKDSAAPGHESTHALEHLAAPEPESTGVASSEHSVAPELTQEADVDQSDAESNDQFSEALSHDQSHDPPAEAEQLSLSQPTEEEKPEDKPNPQEPRAEQLAEAEQASPSQSTEEEKPEDKLKPKAEEPQAEQQEVTERPASVPPKSQTPDSTVSRSATPSGQTFTRPARARPMSVATAAPDRPNTPGTPVPSTPTPVGGTPIRPQRSASRAIRPPRSSARPLSMVEPPTPSSTESPHTGANEDKS